MTAVVGKAWGWVRSWGSSGTRSKDTNVLTAERQKLRGSGGWGITAWIWGSWGRQHELGSPVEEYWEAQEKLQPIKTEALAAGKPEAETVLVPRWWDRYLPTSYLWPRKTEPSGLRHRKRDGGTGDPRERDTDGDFSDYGTPPPSPTPSPSQLTSPFRLFAHSWNVEIVPEHYEICFNFLRHLFDLFVVGFLWTVSPPAKLILEVLGVQGALRLWFHGMAMFIVATVGMAGLLWLIQEYLLQFALIYGIIQALVISVSVRQSEMLGDEEENDQTGTDTDDTRDTKEHKDKPVSVTDKVKTN